MKLKSKIKCGCGKVLLVGPGITAINKVFVDLGQIRGNLSIECKCTRKTLISLDS